MRAQSRANHLNARVHHAVENIVRIARACTTLMRARALLNALRHAAAWRVYACIDCIAIFLRGVFMCAVCCVDLTGHQPFQPPQHTHSPHPFTHHTDTPDSSPPPSSSRSLHPPQCREPVSVRTYYVHTPDQRFQITNYFKHLCVFVCV